MLALLSFFVVVFFFFFVFCVVFFVCVFFVVVVVVVVVSSNVVEVPGGNHLRATTTLPHADAGNRSRVAAATNEGLSPALSRPSTKFLLVLLVVEITDPSLSRHLTQRPIFARLFSYTFRQKHLCLG